MAERGSGEGQGEDRAAGRRRRLAWQAAPWQALLEAEALGILLLAGLLRQEALVTPSVVRQGVILLAPACSLWVAWRMRYGRGYCRQRVAREVGVAVVWTVAMGAGLPLAMAVLGLGDVWARSAFGELMNLLTVTLGSGPVLIMARVGGRLWQGWGRMRRTRMVWGLTHSILVVALCVIVPFALLYVIYVEYGALTRLADEAAGLWPAVATNLVLTIVPALAVTLALMVLALATVSVPVGVVSFLAARRVTRRMETLALATGAMRRGDYAARAVVTGEDEMAQLQQDFNAMADELERTLNDLRLERDRVAALLGARRTLLSGVSHELRTPVATLRGYLEPLLDQEPPLPASVRGDLVIMEGELVRLQGLIDDLFTLARSEEGALALECRPLDVAAVIERVVAALAPLAWEPGRVEVVALSAEGGEATWALADEGRLQQVLLNLLRNGVRHTPPGGIVAIGAETTADGVAIQVRDTGEGIAADDLPYIFDRFYRGESGWRRDSSGAGLGLALARELAEAMGGQIAVDSHPGEGACFTVTLPAAVAPSAPPAP